MSHLHDVFPIGFAASRSATGLAISVAWQDGHYRLDLGAASDWSGSASAGGTGTFHPIAQVVLPDDIGLTGAFQWAQAAVSHGKGDAALPTSTGAGPKALAASADVGPAAAPPGTVAPTLVHVSTASQPALPMSAQGAAASTPAAVSAAAQPSASTAGASHSAGTPQAAATTAAAATLASSKITSGPLSVVDSSLAALYRAYVAGGSAAAAAASSSGSRSGDYVIIDTSATGGNGAALLAELKTLGLLHGSSFGAMASGWLPVDKIAALQGLAHFNRASESVSITSGGSVTNQSDYAERAEIARAVQGLDGTGIKVGILSDSFNTSSSSITMPKDIASDDLPKSTTILQDLANGTDEGRGMGQIIHDIAPGSPILFATADIGGQAGFANNIIRLFNAGARVIVDDVAYFNEAAYQDGPIAQAINQVVAKGAVFFSAAGNNGHEGYEGKYADSGFTDDNGGHINNFTPGAGVHNVLSLSVAFGAKINIVLQWDQPAASISASKTCQSDCDILLYSGDNSTLVASATTNNIGGDPIEVLQFTNTTSITSFNLTFSLASGPAPTDFKLMALGNGLPVDLATNAFNQNDGTTYGHAAAAGNIAMGAAYYQKTPAFGATPPVIEASSSGGPVKIAFDTSGNRLATPTIRATPALTGPDGGDTTFFGESDNDADGWPNFFGTSAAAPAAAAVAALMLQARSTLTYADIRNLMQDSAINMDNPATAGVDAVYDYGTGSGLLQADKAVAFAKTLIIKGDAAHTVLNGSHLDDTLMGTGAEKMVGAGGNDTYYVDIATDVVSEAAGQGTDTIHTTVSYTLPVNVETLILDGTAPISGTGNTLANTITGNAAANLITGAAGNDTMTGGAGADKFSFQAGFGKDVIMDFTAGSAAGHDIGQFAKTLFADFSTLLSHTADSGVNTIITFNAANTVTLNNVHKANFVSADFTFV